MDDYSYVDLSSVTKTGIVLLSKYRLVLLFCAVLPADFNFSWELESLLFLCIFQYTSIDRLKHTGN